MECIPVYKTTVDRAGVVKVHPTNPGVYKIHRALGPMTNENRVMVIIGGGLQSVFLHVRKHLAPINLCNKYCLVVGPASIMFAKTLREHFFEGRIIMISKDSYLPYDRPKLSKVPGISWEDCKLRKDEWFTVCIHHLPCHVRKKFIVDTIHMDLFCRQPM
jgi:hypothetical protein